MRKGQAAHYFADIIPGIIVLFIAYTFLSLGEPNLEISPVIDMTIGDAFERELLTLLQSPATERPGLTYGDWLAVLYLDSIKRPLEQEAFKTAFLNKIHALPIVQVYQKTPQRVEHTFLFDVRFTGASGNSINLDVLSSSPLASLQPATYRTVFFFPTSKEQLRVEVSWARITTTNTQETSPGYA